jgi:HlyD family secretion protein
MKALRQLAPLLLAAVIVHGGCADRVAVPTYQVVRRDFSQRVIAEGFIAASEVTQVVIPSQVRHGGRILWMAEDGSEIEEGQVVMSLDHYDLEQRLDKELAELGRTEVERRRTAVQGRSSVETATTRKDLAGLELGHAERFRRSDDALFSRSDIIQSQIDEEVARARQGRATELESIEGDRARAQVEVVEVRRRKAGLEVDLARSALAALELRAPKRGILLWSRDWRGEKPQIGEQVFSRQVVGEIPDFSALEADVFVLEADAAGVATGKAAEVTIDAHPERVYRARVSRVDPVAKRRFRGSPVQYVGVTLTLDEIDPTIAKPGQRVTAALLLDHEPNALVVPRQSLFPGEDGYFVYVAEGGEFTPRQVDVRTVAPGLAVLEGGLAEGDVVALGEPVAATRRRAATGQADTGSPGA